MVFHTGFIASTGAVYFHDSKTDSKYKMSILEDDEIPFDCVKRGLYRVDELFEKIKSTVTEQFHDELGCLCICLASFYGNEIRKKFIESGQNHGFAKVEIINLITLTYFNAVAPVLAPGCGHRTSLFSKPYILWVIMAKCVDEWEKKKGDEKPMFIKQCQREFSEKVMNEFGIERGRTPDMIINLNCEEYDEIEIKNIFPQCQFFDCSNNQDGILFKTSIMTGDPKVTPFDAKTTLDQSFILHDRFFQYPCTEGYEPLPVVQVIPCGGTNTSAREAKLKVMSSMGLLEEETIQIPSGGAYTLMVNIDTNGIYTAQAV